MKVLVTGANGHLGFNLVAALAARNAFEVRASVRDRNDDAKIRSLRSLQGVELVELDIRNAAQFEAALTGIDTLFHVAANYTIFTKSAEQDGEIVRDSVEGVEVALRSAVKAGVRKVVLTSSVVTLPLSEPGGPLVTEADWLDDSAVPYLRAKTQAERRAWQLSEELGVRLVTLLPGGIGGPGFARRTPTIDLLEGMMLGTLRFGAPRGNFTYVDARDVARGHILAAERDVTGRFILCDQQPSFVEYTQVMHDIDPKVPVAPWVLPDFMLRSLPWFDAINAKLLGSQRFITPDTVAAVKGRVCNVSNARAKAELGWEPEFPFRESLKDTMLAIRALRRSEGNRRMT
jgi:dihydroflavonol-4-reductase